MLGNTIWITHNGGRNERNECLQGILGNSQTEGAELLSTCRLRGRSLAQRKQRLYSRLHCFCEKQLCVEADWPIGSEEAGSEDGETEGRAAILKSAVLPGNDKQSDDDDDDLTFI